jgi:hypothetical protein
MITPAQCRAARAARTDDEVVDEWHHWNDRLAELIKMRDEAETELERRGILVPGKRA